MKTMKLGKFEVCKETAYELGLSLAIAVLGVLTIYGWLMDVVVQSVKYFDSYLENVMFYYVITLLAGLLGIVLMVVSVASCVADAVFKLQGKVKPLFTLVQGGSALLSWLVVAGSTFFANIMTYFYLSGRWGYGDVSIFNSYVNAGMLIWAVLIVSAVKIAISFLFKEDNTVEEISDLGPIE